MLIPALDNAFTMLTSRIARIGSALETTSTQIKTEFFSGLILGIALGLIWTPCAGPILATVSALAATGGITITAILITVFYSIGAAVPMLAVCFGGEKIINSTTALAPYTEKIRKLFGIIIIMSALAIAFHADTFIQEKIAHLFPTIDIEKNSSLQKELAMLHPMSSSSKSTKAPELVGISRWINSEPLTLAQLHCAAR
jgi:hypothetical protein